MNRKQTYDSDDSSSDSESETDDVQQPANDKGAATLSLIDDEKTTLHIPDYKGRDRYCGEEAGECEDVKKISGLPPSSEHDKPLRRSETSSAENDKQKRSEKQKKKKKKLLYICLTNCKYDSVKRAARRYGFKEVGEEEDWNLYWTDFSVSLERVMDMKRYQKINHFPGMSELCRKDLLARNLNRMLKLFPKDYNIFPRSWCLPADFGDFLAYTRQKKNKTYILKPESGCQGKGIWLTKSPKDIKPHEHYLCQQYLSKPFLIDGFKFDMRIYVVVTACDPLRIFVFKEGLGRFATCKYTPPSTGNVSNVFMHLTNYAINKNSSDFNRDDEAGSKRRLTTINRWIADSGYDIDKMWRDIDDVIIKTLISAHTVLKHNYRTCFPNHIRGSACFEVLGFDIVLDKKLRPLVLEVNHSPSFTTDAAIDREIKDVLLYDTLNLVNFGAVDRRKCIEEDRRKVKERLFAKQDKKELKEDQDRAVQKWLEEQTLYEDTHIGNFRRIYPAPGTEKYDHYFHSSGSLYQETAAFKARSECARQQREEISRKQEKLESMLRKKKEGSASGLIRPESPGVAGRTKGKAGASRSNLRSTASITDDDDDGSVVEEKLSQQHVERFSRRKKSKSSLVLHVEDSSQPTEITDAEEQDRLTSLMQRETLVRGLGIIEHVHRLLRSVQTSAGGGGPDAAPAAAVAPAAAPVRQLVTIGGGSVDQARQHAIVVDPADGHYYPAGGSTNSRLTYNFNGNDAHRKQQQSVMSTTSVTSNRNALNGNQSGPPGQNGEPILWKTSTGQHSSVAGNCYQQSGGYERHGPMHRTRYTNRNSSVGGSDSNIYTLTENGRSGATSMKTGIGSSPPVQFDTSAINSSSNLTNTSSGFGGSACSSSHPSVSSTLNILLPHIARSQYHQQAVHNAASSSHFGLSVVSAPAPFAQRGSLPGQTGSEQMMALSGYGQQRVGSSHLAGNPVIEGLRGTGYHHRPSPMRTRDSAGI